MGWLNFGGKKRTQAQGFGDSSKTKSRKRPKSFILEKIVTPSAGIGDWQHEFDHLHQLLGSLSLSDLHLPNFFADSGVCPIDPSGAPTNNLPPLIDFDPLGLYHDGIATQTPYNPGGAFETLPVAVIPVDPHSPNPNNPNAIRQLLDSPFADQPLVTSIDTGVSADSPYLNYANIKKGRDYVGGDDNPLLKAGEGSEHGTFMLGIVDAINKTAPKWVGRAIDSGIWADSLVEFVDAAKASGQKNAIANLSLDLTQKNADGSVTTRYELTPAERSAIEYARQNGVLLVVAAGNDGGVMSVLGQASQEFDNIFTVGAGDINGRSIYSSYGRGLDIVADGGTTEHPDLSTVGNDLGTMAGTSVATAKVAGAASLVWAANPALNYRQVMEILKSTARDLGPSGWDDETGFGFLNTLAAVDLAKKTMPEVYNPTPWVTPDTWSGEGKVTPEERAAKGGNSIATATVQVSTNFSDIDQVDPNQPDKYYQFRVNEPGYVRWNFTSLNPVSGVSGRPNVTIIKADGRSASHSFHKGATVSMSVTTEGQTSFSGGDFYDPGTYYLKVGGVGSTLKDYNISTQFSADRVASFTGNIQYRTQPYKSFDDSQTAVFSGPTVSELKNLSGQVTYNNTDFNSGVAKYGFEVNESGKFRINLNSPNGKMELNINKFIGSEDRPVQIGGFGGVPANSDGWVEVELNKGRYEIEVKTPWDYWREPDWNSAQQTLVRPYTLNGVFTPNAPQPGQGKVPSSAGAFDKTVVSSGVVTHYYANGYLTVQPSGQASWYGYGGGGVTKVTVVPIPDKLPQDYAGNLPNTARNIGNLIGTKTFQDVIDKNDRFDYYKFDLTTDSKVDFALSGKMGNTGFYLFKDWKINSDTSTHIDIISGTTPGVVPEFSETLKAGTYYVLVHKPEGYDGGEYDLKLSAIPLGDPDGNYSIPTSQVIFASADLNDGIDHKAVGSSIGGNLDREDYYRFTLDKISDVDIQLSGDNANAKFYLAKDVNGNGKIDYGEGLQWANQDANTKKISRSLDPGTYYVVVNSDDRVNPTKYNLNVDTKPETAGNFPSAAQDIGLLNGSKTVKGLVDTKADVYDYYRFKLDEPGNVSLKLDKLIATSSSDSQGINPVVSVELMNANNQILASIRGDSSSAAPINRVLEPGYYYVRVNSTDTTGYASYELTLNGEPPYKKAIDAEYARYQGLLGFPTTGYWRAGDSPNGTKGYGQNYNNGSVYWTAKSGAIALWHEFADTYNQKGGSSGWLGFPTKGKWDWEGGERIDFEGGYIYWTEKERARAFKNGELPWEKSIAAEYARYQGLLGSPTTGYWQAGDSPMGTKGYGQNYNNGSVYWTAKSGAIALWYGFVNTYNQTGGSNGWLGFPTKGKETDSSGGQRIDFEGGYIYWTEKEGAKAYHPWETPNTNTVNNGPTINQKPIIINFPNFEMPYGASFSLQTYANQLQISDPDGDAIQFYEISLDPSRVGMEAWVLEGQPLGKYLIPADKFNTIKFYGSFLGSNPVVVRAYDGKEWSDPKSFNITVIPSSNTGGVVITPGNGGSPLTNSPPPTSGTSPSTVSEAGLRFIAGHEGIKLNLYNDPAGHCTIGIGHLLHYGNCNGSEPAEFRSGISEQRAYELLRADVNTAVQAVKSLVKVSLNQQQFDALVSFTFNLGAGYLQQSDLLKRLNAGEYSAVPYELSRWVYGGGVKLPGLVRRRNEEGILFRDGIYTGVTNPPVTVTPPPNSEPVSVIEENEGNLADGVGFKIEHDLLTVGPLKLNKIQSVLVGGGSLLFSFDEFSVKAKVILEKKANAQLAAENLLKLEAPERGFNLENIYASVSAAFAGLEIKADKLTGVLNIDSDNLGMQMKLSPSSAINGDFILTTEIKTPLKPSIDGVTLQENPYYEVKGSYAAIPKWIYETIPVEEPGLLMVKPWDDPINWLLAAPIIVPVLAQGLGLAGTGVAGLGKLINDLPMVLKGGSLVGT